MNKLQFLIRPATPTSRSEFSERFLGLGPRLLELGPRQLTLTYTAEPPPRLSLIPFRKTAIGLVSIAAESLQPQPWVEALQAGLPGAELSGYLVDEVLPVEYSRGWPDGEETPGIGLLTLLRRPARLDHGSFIRRWHGHHTPLSLEIHPLWNYVRGEVKEVLLPGSAPFDGIVEEHFRRRQDLLNPVHFFGGPLRVLPNMIRVGLDVKGFIDMRTIENYLVRERHLRS